jgi:phage tail tape-measure protein
MRLLVMIICFAVAGCGGNEETTTVTTADGEEVKITQSKVGSGESGTITFDGRDGEGKITFGDGAAGQPLPLGLSVYPGGEVKGTFTSALMLPTRSSPFTRRKRRRAVLPSNRKRRVRPKREAAPASLPRAKAAVR